jgi:hypothetical protein
LAETVLALAGGASFQFMVDFVADAAGFVDGLFHGEDKTGNGLIGPSVLASSF